MEANLTQKQKSYQIFEKKSRCSQFFSKDPERIRTKAVRLLLRVYATSVDFKPQWLSIHSWGFSWICVCIAFHPQGLALTFLRFQNSKIDSDLNLSPGAISVYLISPSHGIQKKSALKGNYSTCVGQEQATLDDVQANWNCKLCWRGQIQEKSSCRDKGKGARIKLSWDVHANWPYPRVNILSLQTCQCSLQKSLWSLKATNGTKRWVM